MKRPVHVYVRRRSESADNLASVLMKAERDFWKAHAERLQDQLEQIADAAHAGNTIILDVVGEPLIQLERSPTNEQGESA